MNESMKRAAGAAGLLCALALVAPAQAADPREKQAARAFFAGKYEQALNLYIDLAATTGNAAYICDIGRTYQRLGKLDEAISNLRDCLTQAKLDAGKRAGYKTMLAELEAKKQSGGATPAAAPAAAAAAPLAPGGVPADAPPGSPPVPPAYLQGAPAPAPPPPPPPAAPGYPPPAPAPGYPPVAPAAGYPPAAVAPAQPGHAPAPPASLDARPEGGQSRSGNTAAYVIGGIGVAAAAGGVAFGLMARKTFDEVEREFDADKENTGKRYNIFQLVGYGVGAAGIGTAVVLLLRGGGSPERASTGHGLEVAVHPQGLSVGGRF